MSWSNTKKQVDTLPKNWQVVARSYEQNEPLKIKVENFGKHKRTLIKMKPINGFTTQLIAYKEKDGNTKESFYVVFNEELNIAYKRSIS